MSTPTRFNSGSGFGGALKSGATSGTCNCFIGSGDAAGCCAFATEAALTAKIIANKILCMIRLNP
jgi:hypothetical protein